MTPDYQDYAIDRLEIEAKARRLRAEALAHGVRSLRRWVAGSFHRDETAKL